MRKGEKDEIKLVLGIGAVVVIMFFLMYTGNFPFQQKNNETALNDTPNYIAPTPPPHSACTDISHAYHTQIDRVAPNYLETRRQNCLLAGGTWYDSETKAGCFDIPYWDARNCLSTELNLLRNVCDSLEGTKWVCDSHQVGCVCE